MITKEPEPIPETPMVIVQCPKCKTRKEVKRNDWIKSCLPLSTPYFCENVMCEYEGPMLFHKDVEDSKKGFE